MNIPNQFVQLPFLEKHEVRLALKREDTIHPFVSGNKYRKLKFNLFKAQQDGFKTLLTFGGAYSNHIAATAFAGQESGLKTIGIIRGEELESSREDNPTLKLAAEHGMDFQFVSREDYRNKKNESFLETLRKKHGDFYLIPEGGSNELAIKGCEEILTKEDDTFTQICCAVGTGGTISGLINSAKKHQKILGFPALKGDFLKSDIRKFAQAENWDLVMGYHFGGYAKINSELVEFINDFKATTGIPLDPIYTGKMLFGIFDLIKKGYFNPGTQILAIHTGGLQGIKGMNEVLKRKNLPLLDL